MTSIVIRNLVKSFGSTTAVAGINLTINSGELFCLLGPSGCGKTTLLRMIAGFVDPTAGSIHFDAADVTHLPPNRRDTGMVFQSYALWPHMSVLENVAYGLGVRKVPRAQKHQRAMQALKTIHMDHLAARKPTQLSGGQQQRVALARALVIKPSVLLLDEPLSNLDAALRLEMRDEIRRICKQSRITTVYVTHDQKEAMAIADGIAVLRAGRLLQAGSPREVYNHPRSIFVARFLGETNLLAGTLTALNEHLATLSTPAGQIRCTLHQQPGTDRQMSTSPVTPPLLPTPLSIGSTVSISLRPEAIRTHANSDQDNSLDCRIVHSVYLGDSVQHSLSVEDDLTLRMIQLHPSSQPPADHLRVYFSPDDARIVSGDDPNPVHC